MAERIATLPVPAVVFAPHDDLTEQTARAIDLLGPDCQFVDLPDLGLDIFHEAPDRMVALIEDYLSASATTNPETEDTR